jgi:hypothetical protein
MKLILIKEWAAALQTVRKFIFQQSVRVASGLKGPMTADCTA